METNELNEVGKRVLADLRKRAPTDAWAAAEVKRIEKAMKDGPPAAKGKKDKKKDKE